MSRPTKRRLDWRGLPINVEIEVGDTKSGVDPFGNRWEHTYSIPYGEIARTDGADGDPVDVYLGPDQESDRVFVVSQLTGAVDPRERVYDEEKVFLGFRSLDEVTAAYYAHGPSWGMGGVTEMDFEAFKADWLARGAQRGHDTVMFGAPA